MLIFFRELYSPIDKNSEQKVWECASRQNTNYFNYNIQKRFYREKYEDKRCLSHDLTKGEFSNKKAFNFQ